MVTDNFSRYEFKFPVSFETMDRLVDDLEPYTQADKHAGEFGYYCLSSIYFDNEALQCYHETMNGDRFRQKIRLRVYRNYNGTVRPVNPDDAQDGFIAPSLERADEITADTTSFFENKAKINGLVVKRRTSMRLGDAMDFAEMTRRQVEEQTDPRYVLSDENIKLLRKFRPSNEQVLKEIQYIILNKKLMTRNVVSYERMALFARDDPQLRITFDINVRTRDTDLDLAKGTYGKPTSPQRTAVLEIKTGKDIPLWLSQILAQYQYRNMTFSKYCSHYVNMLGNGALYASYVAERRNAAKAASLSVGN